MITLISGFIAPAAANAAVTYWYKPSHPMNWAPKASGHDCTGGWGIRSSINYPYFLTAGHCLNTNASVFGTTGKFGTLHITHLYGGTGVDTAIVAPDAGTDGLQEIPGVGRTVGKDGNVYSTTGGNGVAMQGANSGRTYGTLFSGWYSWFNGKRVACGTYPSVGGDSGSPVFYHRGSSVYALGVHVGMLGSTHHCYVTIDDLLADWNAWLPVFSSKAAKNADAKPDVLLKAQGVTTADSLPVQYIGEPVTQ